MSSRSRRLDTLAVVLALAATVPAGLVGTARADQPAPSARPALTRPPKLVRFVAAVYPEAEQAAGRTASVVLQVDLAADGHVTAAVVTTSAGPAFDAAAIAAVLQFGFEPAEIDGAPAPIRILYQYDFVLETRVEAKTTGDFSGVVRDRASHRPLAGITIDLGDGKTAVTDDAGRFEIVDVAPGARTVTLSGAAITALSTQEELLAGKRLDVTYDLAPSAPADDASDGDDLEIVIVAPPLERAAASVAIAAGQGRKVPGTGGDVLKVVESMPGVARAAAGSGALVVWGASPEDTRVYVDGVRIPRLYHTGGLRSVLATDLVQSIELVPGGYGAAYGRGLGGLVTVGLAPLGAGDSDRSISGSASADIIDSAAVVRFPIASRVRAAVAARRSQLGWVLDHVSSRDPSELFPIPRYHDGQARVDYAIGPRQHVEVGGLVSSDRVTRTVASADPAATKSQAEDVDFYRAWARYQHDLDAGDRVEVVAYAGADAASRIERFGATPTELAIDTGVYGARASWRGRLSRHLVATVGVDAELSSAAARRTGSISVPAREGDARVFGQPPPDQINFDTWHVVTGSAAPYAQVDVAAWGDRLHVIPGLRLEPFLISVDRRSPEVAGSPATGLFAEDVAVQPRLAIRLDATRFLALHAAYGQYRQLPQVEDLSAVFGSPTLPIADASHYVVGAAVRWTDKLSSELTGFVTRSRDLAVRSPASTPLLAQALVPDGTGRVVGAQLLIRQELTAGLFGWISYSLVKSERTDRPGAAARPFDFDQTHILTAVASWDLGHGIELGARFRYATGMPRTPVTSAYFDSRVDGYQPLFGERNGERLPAFVQVDARAAKRFTLGGDELEVYLELQNATDRDNAEEVVYSADFRDRSYIRGLPILPVIGARLTW